MGFIKLLVFVLLFNTGCDKKSAAVVENEEEVTIEQRDYREDMRSFVIGLSEYAKTKNPDFSVIPQNGIELVTDSGYPSGTTSNAYLNAIDGNGQESLFYGYEKDNKETPTNVTDAYISLLKISQNAGNSILVTDYCSSENKIEDAYAKNFDLNFIPFVATERDLSLIPDIPSETSKTNGSDITSIDEAKNFLYILNYENYDNKNQLLSALGASNYDIILLDMFFNDGTPFSRLSIEELKYKPNGGERKVICYMSIGEAEDYRYYWEDAWDDNAPDWLDAENSNWPGNYKVKYWNKDWQNLIYGSEEAYLDRIVAAGYDGVYLDIIDGFDYFENK